MSRFLERRLSRLAPPGAKASPADRIDRLFHARAPAQFVALGRVVGAVRNAGELRVRPLNPDADGESLAQAKAVWVVRRSSSGAAWAQIALLKFARHGGDWALLIDGVERRELAEQFLHAEVGLDRAELPPLDDDTHYWVDLIGCRVRHRDGRELGTIERLETNGVQDWMVVGPHWIPFVDAHVDAVDLSAKEVRVDWDPDWLRD